MEPSLRCPSCGNHLTVADVPSITCPFCQTSVPVPAMFRPAQVIAAPPQNPYNMYPPIRPPTEPETVVATGAGCGVMVAIVVGVLLVFVGVGVSLFMTVKRSVPSVPSPPSPVAAEPDDPLTPKKKPPLVTFGGNGTGTGHMTDGRALALGTEGQVWVAEYEDGHVLEFDKKGKFVRTIQVPPESPNGNIYISALAADRAGHLFVARNGGVLRLSTKTGAVEKTFAGVGTGIDSLTVDSSGAVWGGTGPGVVRWDVEGKVLHRGLDLITKVNKKDAAVECSIAVDGTGRLFVASMTSGTIYVFDAELKYQNRFPVKVDSGTASIDGLALDPSGHLYVAYFTKVSVYDADGGFVRDVPEVDFGLRSLALDDRGHIFVMATADQNVLEFGIPK